MCQNHRLRSLRLLLYECMTQCSCWSSFAALSTGASLVWSPLRPTGSAHRLAKRNGDPGRSHSGRSDTIRSARTSFCPRCPCTGMWHLRHLRLGFASLVYRHLILLRLFRLSRLIKEIDQDLHAPQPYHRWQITALEALHMAAEHFMVGFLGHANLAAIHAGRVTLKKKDLLLIKRIRGDMEPDVFGARREY